MSTDLGASQPAAADRGESGSTIAFHDVTLKFRPGRYRVKSFHARGGMGEVWRGEDSEIGREIALKTLTAGRPNQHHRFLQEAQITGQLEHPGIVPLHDVGLDEQGRPFYVMKFVHGCRLKDAVAEYHGNDPALATPREVQRLRLLSVFVDLCQTIAYAHSRGVIHRDLKPDNVMIGPFGETIVLDWGLAKVTGQPDMVIGTSDHVHVTSSGATANTVAGAVIGAPPYMSPEMAEGKAAEADARTDVFLLGATLYEILTGNPPRRGSNRDEIIELARTSLPPSPRTVKPDVPRALEAICVKAMARRQQDRYSTALALAEDVQRYLAGETVSAYREGPLARGLRWAKRHRTALLRSAAAVIVLLGGLFAWAQVRQAQQDRVEAERKAGELAALGKARGDVSEFLRLADEARFYAAHINPDDEKAPYYDIKKGEGLGQAALAIARPWEADISTLPLIEERDRVKQALHELLLVLAQARSRHAKSQPARGRQAAHPQAAEEMLELLTRAEKLAGPSRSYHRLRTSALRLMQREGDAAKEDQLEGQVSAGTTALDDFLAGEEIRTGAIRLADAQTVRLAWQPDKEALTKASEQFRQALEKDPDHYWARLQLGRCLLSLGQDAEAVEILGACVALRPQAPWSYSVRGLAQAKRKQFAAAEKDLNRALKLDPLFRPARLNLAVTYWLQGPKQYARALAELEQVLQPPDDQRLVEASYYRGLIYLHRAPPAKGAKDQDYQQALRDFTQVLQEKPGLRPALLARSQLCLLMANEEQALADLNTYLKSSGTINSEEQEACQQRGHLLRLLIARLPAAARARPLELARRELDKAVELGGQDWSLFEDLGAVLYHQKQTTAALDCYAKALEHAPQSERASLLNQRGSIYVNEKPKQYEKAKADYAAAVRYDPKTPEERLSRAEAHAGLGYVHACLQATADAQQETTRALVWLQGVDHYLIWHNLAGIYGELFAADTDRQEHEEMAITLLRQSLALAKKTGKEAAEVGNIKADQALRSLWARQPLKQLIESQGE